MEAAGQARLKTNGFPQDVCVGLWLPGSWPLDFIMDGQVPKDPGLDVPANFQVGYIGDFRRSWEEGAAP